MSTLRNGASSEAPTQYGLPQRMLTLLRDVLSAHPEVEAAILFGSRANGSFRPESDIDLALIGHCPSPALARITFELNELPTPYTFDVLAFEQVTHPSSVRTSSAPAFCFTARRNVSRRKRRGTRLSSARMLCPPVAPPASSASLAPET